MEGAAVSNKLSKQHAEAARYKSELEKRGIVYLSRIPPFMKPNKVKSIFEEYGEVTRLFLQEEDSSVRMKRKAAGGNASKQFTEGWVEFSDKNVAQQVAESLNNTKIAGRKGDYYHDDLWNLKFLKKFKWDYLTEKLAYERRIRENKVNLAMTKAKKINADFAEKIEKSVVAKHMTEKKRKRGEIVDNSIDGEELTKRFKQRSVLATQHGENEAQVFDRQVLGKMFKGSK